MALCTLRTLSGVPTKTNFCPHLYRHLECPASFWRGFNGARARPVPELELCVSLYVCLHKNFAGKIKMAAGGRCQKRVGVGVRELAGPGHQSAVGRKPSSVRLALQQWSKVKGEEPTAFSLWCTGGCACELCLLVAF